MPELCEHCQGERRANGNCPTVGPDGLPVQCVGFWASHKHHYVRNYIEATRAVRKKYLPPRGIGGAAFIDLFAGPGLARVRGEDTIIDGSPLIAANHAEAPFTEIVLCELDDENADSVSARLGQDRRVRLLRGNCNELIDEVARAVPRYGLNVALVDPFAPSNLQWSTIQTLGRFDRMDIILHFPTGAIKRNFGHVGFGATLDAFLGTDAWRDDVRTKRDVPRLVNVHLRRQLEALGYEHEEDIRAIPVKNSKNVILYHLVFASKHLRGTKIWKSITTVDASGQKGFGF